MLLLIVLSYLKISLSLSQMDFFLILFSLYFLVMIMNIEYVIYKSTTSE